MFRNLLCLLLLTAAVSARGADDAEAKKSTPTVPTTEKSPSSNAKWKIASFGILGGKTFVALLDESAHQIMTLGIEPDKDDNKLISAEFTTDSDQIHIVAKIGGTEHSITQKLSNMPNMPPSTAINKRGPSDDDRKKYESLSEPAKEKLREAIRAKFSDTDFRNTSEEDRRATINSIFEKIEKEDKGGK